ncbi:MAG: RimK family alpha-L-glutamate ligase [Clostridia bacterium]|nr:RimK family alpha-L-glutamate ligase [Clostridia bacterium]
MKHGLLIRNSYWPSASMDEMEALLVSAAARMSIALHVCGNGDIPCVPGTAPKLPAPADFILFWDKDVRLCQYLEMNGYPVYNSSRAIALCDDKTLTHLHLHDLPVPQTILCPLTFPGRGYPDLGFLDQAAQLLSYPMVIKEGCGSFGQQVYLASNREETAEILTRFAGKSLLLQQYIQESHGQDKRLYMAGGQCVAAMRRINETDFRANIASGGKALPYTPTKEEIALAVNACSQLGLTFAGVDILDSANGPMLCEVNSNAHFTALYHLTKVDIAAHILDAVRGAQ